MRTREDELKCLLVGQSYDLHWTHLVAVPTIEDYLRMVDGSKFGESRMALYVSSLLMLKLRTETGGLFRMLSRFMISQSNSSATPESLNRLMILFGRFFQIRDDYANLMSDQVRGTTSLIRPLTTPPPAIVVSSRRLGRNLGFAHYQQDA